MCVHPTSCAFSKSFVRFKGPLCIFFLSYVFVLVFCAAHEEDYSGKFPAILSGPRSHAEFEITRIQRKD